MKRIIVALLVFVLLLASLAGCGQQEGPAPSTTEPGKTEASSPGTDKKPDWEEEGFVVDPTNVKVGLLLSGTLGDESINDQAYAGLKEVQEKFGVQINYVEVIESSMYIDVLQSMGDQGYDLVICDSFSMSDPLEQVAPIYPDIDFMLLDTNLDVENVTSFTYATHEVSFLTGVVSAMASESGVIGFIGGMAIPTIEKYQVGFEEGVAYVDPDATVIPKYIGNDDSAWNDPTTAKSLSLDIIANGADVLFHAAGASGMGMFEACVEKDVWAIGVNIDQEHLAPKHMLSSALTKGDRAIYLFVESYLKGDLLKGFQTLNCANGGVGLVESQYLTKEMKDAIADVESKIISGEIVVTNVLDY